jgi:hypothetical protein
MAGIRERDKRALRLNLRIKICTTFVLCSQYVLLLLDHENRKTPISKPAANAQRPNVQAETMRTRIRRSCGISWDRSFIAAVSPEQQLPGPSFVAERHPGRPATH